MSPQDDFPPSLGERRIEVGGRQGRGNPRGGAVVGYDPDRIVLHVLDTTEAAGGLAWRWTAEARFWCGKVISFRFAHAWYLARWADRRRAKRAAAGVNRVGDGSLWGGSRSAFGGR